MILLICRLSIVNISTSISGQAFAHGKLRKGSHVRSGTGVRTLRMIIVKHYRKETPMRAHKVLHHPIEGKVEAEYDHYVAV
jgi:hypothetical protein